MTAKHYTAEKNVATVVALLKKYGIRRVIASPGTTNLTFVASLQRDPFFTVYSAPEERSAAYMAVGMAEESGEPVVITCTGATASRNYLPGLTEAYYRKLPVLAVTATQPFASVGQYVPQVIDRAQLPKDTAVYSVHIPFVKDAEDQSFATLKTNEALHYLTKAGGGPVHINLETHYIQDFSIKELPDIPKIGYYRIFDSLPEIPKGKIGIYVGSHSKFSQSLKEAIDRFCDAYGAVVFCDNTSNYFGPHRFQYPLVLSQDNWACPGSGHELIIYIGGVSGAYCRPGAKHVWRVNEDGTVRAAYGLPQAVFEMREEDFFNRYADMAGNTRPSHLKELQGTYDALHADIPENLPFSNIAVAKYLAPKIPQDSVMHFGILNSLRSWNFFTLPQGVDTYCNVGGFGIDGPISTAIGGALALQNRLHFLVVGDLAFFYDMNALGNRHLPGNLRILLVNNGRGTEFTNYNHPASNFGADADTYMAAAGHYGRKSPDLVRHYAEDLGIVYFKAENMADIEKNAGEFLNPQIEKPILMEVFTDSKYEDEALHIIRHLRTSTSSVVENQLRRALGPKGINAVKKILGK